MKIAIVHFYAFNQLHTKVFYKGETPMEMHLALSQIYPGYLPVDLLTGDMQNASLKTLLDTKEKMQADESAG